MRIPTSNLLVAHLLATSVSARCTGQAKDKFVSVEGDKFTLGGKPFHFAGSNAYYFPFNGVCSFAYGYLFFHVC